MPCRWRAVALAVVLILTSVASAAEEEKEEDHGWHRHHITVHPVGGLRLLLGPGIEFEEGSSGQFA